jgi:Spy/CpxP family protein refolding chaperone
MKRSRGCWAGIAACLVVVALGAHYARADGEGVPPVRRTGIMGAPGTDEAGATRPRRNTPAPLPSFPDAPQIYHEGALDFFLGRGDQLELSDKQRTDLAAIRTRAERKLAAAAQKVARAEEDLWALTTGTNPDAVAIEAKIAEIGQIEGDRRLAFIRDVGDAARVLTKEQRTIIAKNPTARPSPAGPRTAPEAPRAPSRRPAPATEADGPTSAASRAAQDGEDTFGP